MMGKNKKKETKKVKTDEPTRNLQYVPEVGDRVFFYPHPGDSELRSGSTMDRIPAIVVSTQGIDKANLRVFNDGPGSIPLENGDCSQFTRPRKRQFFAFLLNQKS
jgi:hypothetical protein